MFSLLQLNNECNRLFAVAEDNPDLKANEQFINLQKTLAKIENNLQAARRFYNSNVSAINRSIVTFPTSFVANKIGMQKKAFFEAEEIKKQDVKMEF